MVDNQGIDAEDAIFEIIAETKRDGEARYHHRLHAVLLVLQGISARRVGELLGESNVTVSSWVRKFKAGGMDALKDKKRPGRPKRLTRDQESAIAKVLCCRPTDCGLEGYSWDGALLSAWIEMHFELKLGLRQCQRMMRGFAANIRLTTIRIHAISA